MSPAQIPSVQPPFPFEAYSHVLGPIAAEDGGGYQFSMPDFPGLLADGDTEMEAIADGREAFLAVVSALVDQELPIPAPQFKIQDFAPVAASGRLLTRVPKSMHRQLAARAKTEGVSLNTLVLTLIAEGLGRRSAVDISP